MGDKDQLVQAALEVREKAYVPYSKFKVGAALMGQSGTIYAGCNIENASFSLACCAERTAIFKAVSQGETTFKQMAVIADTKGAVSPCGACRQVMAEFFTEDVAIYLGNTNGHVSQTSVGALLPFHFSL